MLENHDLCTQSTEGCRNGAETVDHLAGQHQTTLNQQLFLSYSAWIQIVGRLVMQQTKGSAQSSPQLLDSRIFQSPSVLKN